MEPSVLAAEGMVVTPHYLATQSAIAILREGGTAMEAAVAAAATLAVVYPHMNGIGGDSFWLILHPSKEPIVIEACGAAGSQANLNFYKDIKKIPYRGPKSANTVAGTVGGWQEVLKYVEECGYYRKSVARLLTDAINYAENGYPASSSFVACLNKFVEAEETSREFRELYLPEGKVPKVGDMVYNKNLANTLNHLSNFGLESFYRGELAQLIADEMATAGMPITKSDLENYYPVRKNPLRLLHSQGELFNTPPPTQGIVSLAILGMLDKLKIDGKNEGEFIHATVEATKQAFQMRDDHVTDPNYMKIDPNELINDRGISNLIKEIDLNVAGSGPVKGPGDTVWLGVMDKKGFSVSFIQSIYHHFGSSVVLPKTGIVWHNRGVAFTLDTNQPCSLVPRKKPYHTLNPAAAVLKDGRTMIYGTRGGDGQPQTQAAIFHRYVVQELPLQKSISLPRWLYGSTAGDYETALKLESRFSEDTIMYLKDRGHDVVMIPEYSEEVGQAGALVRHPNGVMEGAFDPRANGSAAGI